MRLQDICKVFTDGDWIESKDQSDEGIRLVQTGNIGEGKFLEKGDRAKYISEETFDSLKCTEIFPGDILVSRLPEPVGRVCIIPEKEERMITAVDCTICRPYENMILKEYLCYFMQSEAYYTRLMNNVTGTTRKRISRKNLGNVELDIPDKETQEAVVKNLDALSRIIDGRKEELDKLDELVKARFVELFGDPFTNEKGWPEATISDFYKVKGGKRIPKGMGYSDVPTSHPYLRATDMKNETILDNDIHYIDDNVFEKIKRYTVEGGDIYLTNVGVNLGMAGVIPDKFDGANLTENAVKLVPTKGGINPKCIAHYINSDGIQNYINERKMAVGVPKLAIFRIETMPLLIPDKRVQDEFVEFKEQVDKSKVVALKAA